MNTTVEHVTTLRKQHLRIDQAVLAAYGWHIPTRRWGPAIKLRHDFYEVDYLPENDNVRYTIHPEARREVLKRLLLLNHEIHEAEERGVDYAVVDGEKIQALMLDQVKAWCPRAEQLHWKTLKFLCTGEDLLPSLEQSLTKSYKPFVTAYASGLENELLERVFVPFHEAFLARYPEADKETRVAYLDAQLAADPSRLSNLVKILKKGEAHYELGTMQFVLSLIRKPSGNTLAKSELLQALRRSVVEGAGEHLLDKRFLAQLEAFPKTYRNAAAHTGEIGKAEAEGCFTEVREMLGWMLGEGGN